MSKDFSQAILSFAYGRYGEGDTAGLQVGRTFWRLHNVLDGLDAVETMKAGADALEALRNGSGSGWGASTNGQDTGSNPFGIGAGFRRAPSSRPVAKMPQTSTAVACV